MADDRFLQRLRRPGALTTTVLWTARSVVWTTAYGIDAVEYLRRVLGNAQENAGLYERWITEGPPKRVPAPEVRLNFRGRRYEDN